MSGESAIPDGHPDPVDYLAGRIEELESRIERLENRLDADDGGQDPAGTLDRYDASVLDQLTEGQHYTLSELKQYYQRAGLRKDRTIKRRIKHLTQTYCRQTGTQSWRFTGGGE